MNVCSLEFPDESFDAVTAKGTMDAILCGEGSTANVAKMCQEVSRVLKAHGVFFIVSYGVPDNRLQYLENEVSHSLTQSHSCVVRVGDLGQGSRLVGWLVGWLVGCFVGSLVRWFVTVVIGGPTLPK